jgi:uncharacterized protein (TIGR02118 family)
MTDTSHPSRRGLLKGSGTALAAGAAAAAGFTVQFNSTSAQASENQKGDRVLTVLFPNGENAHFDFEYYIGHHIPLVLGIYGKSIRRYEVIKPAGGAKAPYIAISQIWIADEKAYAEASKGAQKKFGPDVPNFTNVTPVGQAGELYGTVENS